MKHFVHGIGWKTVLLCTVALASMFGGSGCSNDSGSLQRAYDQAYGGDVLATGPAVRVSATVDGGYDLAVADTSQQVTATTLVFASGEVEHPQVGDLGGTVVPDTTATLSYIKVQLTGGDYWYFDRFGTWLPNGYKPQISADVTEAPVPGADGKGASGISLLGTAVHVVSSDAYYLVRVGYSDGSQQTLTQSTAMFGTYPLQLGKVLEAVRITCVADGTQWWYNALGETLPLSSRWYADMD